MVVGRRNGLWMVIEKTRTKRANYKVVGLEGLMNRWRLMNTTGNRFEIMNGKRPGIQVSVPAYGIKRMRSISKRIYHSLLLDHHFEVTFFIMSFHVHGLADITLAEGRMLQQLPVFIAISLGRNDGAVRFHNHQSVICILKFYLINSATRNDQIIPITKVKITINSL